MFIVTDLVSVTVNKNMCFWCLKETSLRDVCFVHKNKCLIIKKKLKMIILGVIYLIN